MLDARLYRANRIGQYQCVCFSALQHVKRKAFRRAAADAWERAELLNELDHAIRISNARALMGHGTSVSTRMGVPRAGNMTR